MTSNVSRFVELHIAAHIGRSYNYGKLAMIKKKSATRRKMEIHVIYTTRIDQTEDKLL